MALKRLEYIPGFLNSFNSPVQNGIQEPITGQSIPGGGLTPGDYFDLTSTEAAAYSNTAVGTLLEGRYMWVQLDLGAVNAGNGQLQRGQGLFWKLGGATPYLVTNVESAACGLGAGIYIDTIAGGVANVVPGNWFFMQAIAPGRATLKFRAAITNGAPAAGDGIYFANQGAGVDAGLFDDNPLVTLANATQFAVRFVGAAEVAPANGSLTIVEIQKPGPVRI